MCFCFCNGCVAADPDIRVCIDAFLHIIIILAQALIAQIIDAYIYTHTQSCAKEPQDLDSYSRIHTHTYKQHEYIHTHTIIYIHTYPCEHKRRDMDTCRSWHLIRADILHTYMPSYILACIHLHANSILHTCIHTCILMLQEARDLDSCGCCTRMRARGYCKCLVAAYGLHRS